eukprot:TRINITY_DN4475_c0_g1_i1.p1 TRINITY_DN4475_c0_g1~~TRINITY_DN4475_c0_g1_i1.p1  ORF type:complete len:425 (-),score=18.09 TRINITY_DN4475_c0_g1_i1:631-1905(-)
MVFQWRTCKSHAEMAPGKKRKTAIIVSRCVFLLLLFAVCRLLISSLFSIWQPFFAKPEEKDDVDDGEKVLEVPQIVWGLNNQKIAVARAALTARFLNRTLRVPVLSASNFYKETNLLQPVPFDHVFDLPFFNSRCADFVRMSARAGHARPETRTVKKGSGRRWTKARDMAQLKELRKSTARILRIEGKNPFLWHDHWPVKDYSSVFQCMALLPNLTAEVSRVVNALRSKSEGTKTYVAVHMRIEKDWIIHCKNLESRAVSRDGKRLSICANKTQIISRVSLIPGIQTPIVVYVAVAEDLLEENSVLDGWGEGFFAVEKKALGVAQNVYGKYPYLIQSAIDFEVCLQSDVFVGNSYSTFSSLIVLHRTLRSNGCSSSTPHLRSFAYNLEGEGGAAKRWVTNMSDASLDAISYGSDDIFSCNNSSQ